MDPHNPLFDTGRAYKITDPARYPTTGSNTDSGDQLQSGWLYRRTYLNGALNTLDWTVGAGYVVTFGTSRRSARGTDRKER